MVEVGVKNYETGSGESDIDLPEGLSKTAPSLWLKTILLSGITKDSMLQQHGIGACHLTNPVNHPSVLAHIALLICFKPKFYRPPDDLS